MKIIQALGLFFLLFNFSACSTLAPSVGYLWQATRGQLAIMNRAQPLEKVLENPRLDPRIKKLLEEIPEMKAFGEANALKATGNYEEFVQWDGDAVIWVVSASEPLSFQAKRWSFPIVGSLTYLGWFDRDKADSHGERLKEENLDVYVRGASAYSTLGWFRDPVISTMISKGAHAHADLVNVILHESVHATFYIKGQSTFNESLAKFVGDRLTDQYLEKMNEKNSGEAFAGEMAEKIKAYHAAEKSRARVGARLSRLYWDLQAIYKDESNSKEKKLSKKEKLISEARAELGWDERRVLNNATLVQFQTYGTGMEEFETLFQSVGQDWNRFWELVLTLDKDSFSEPQQKDFSELVLGLVSSVETGGIGERKK
jgi:predicted aminopeptidase